MSPSPPRVLLTDPPHPGGRLPAGNLRAGDWQVRGEAGARTFELRGRTLGVVGFGAVGRRIGEIASHGFGMRLATCTTTPSAVPGGIATLSLPDLFAASDFIVIACPLTPATRGMVNRDVLAFMPPVR